jgi:hypothetical protein
VPWAAAAPAAAAIAAAPATVATTSAPAAVVATDAHSRRGACTAYFTVPSARTAGLFVVYWAAFKLLSGTLWGRNLLLKYPGLFTRVRKVAVYGWQHHGSFCASRQLIENKHAELRGDVVCGPHIMGFVCSNLALS